MLLAFRSSITLLLAFCLSVVLPQQLQAQISTPKYSNEFLRLGVGARAAGMGNSQAAIVDDIAASYWNPAGLTRSPYKNNVGLMHSEYFAGIAKYDWAAVSTEIDEGRHLGLSFIRLGVDDIPNTLNFFDGTNFDYSRITRFAVADMAFILSFAQAIKKVEGLSVGTNLKVVNRRVGPFANAWGFGLDFGLQYFKKGWRAGLMLNDISSTFNAWQFNTETFDSVFIETGNEIPQNSVEVTLPSARLGFGYEFFREKKFNLVVTADVDLTFDGQRNTVASLGRMSLDPKIGVEASYKRIVFVRGGVYNMQFVPDIEDGGDKLKVFPTAGVGFSLLNIVNVPLTIDYALSNVGSFDEALYSHIVSVRFSFNKIKF